MKKIKIWLLCGILLLVACGSGDEMTEPVSEEPGAAAVTRAVLEATLEALDAEATASALDETDVVQAPVATTTPETIASPEVLWSTPEEALNHYITSCDIGDTVSATEVIAMGVRSLCEPADALSSVQVGEFEISGKTARVQWEWTLPEGASEKHEFTLGQQPQGWRIMDMKEVDKIWLEEEVVEVEIEIQEQFDDQLSDQIIHLVQDGEEGEKNVTTKHTKTWNDGTGTTESEIINEEIMSEGVPMIVTVGQKPESEIASELVGQVEGYFTSYQAGQYADLLALAKDAAEVDYANASEVAQLEIVSFEISEPSAIGLIQPTMEEDFEWANKDRRFDYSDSAELVVEPFLMQVEVPVNIKYKLFGIEFDSKTKFRLRASPDDKAWTMPFWGVTGASQVGEEVTLKDATITLDGVATTHNAIIVALTMERSAQTTAATIGQNSQYAQCIDSPRCYIRFQDLSAPDTFTLLLESGLIGFGSESHEFEIQLTR